MVLFSINEQDGQQSVLMVTSTDNNVTLGNREISRRTAESHCYVFLWGKVVSVSLPTGYGKSFIYQAAPVVATSSPEEILHYNYCAVVKAQMEDKEHYLNGLGVKELSAFNTRSRWGRCCKANRAIQLFSDDRVTDCYCKQRRCERWNRFESAMLIEHRPFLTLYQTSLIILFSVSL